MVLHGGKTPHSSISAWSTTSTDACRVTSRATPPSPPPTTRTFFAASCTTVSWVGQPCQVIGHYSAVCVARKHCAVGLTSKPEMRTICMPQSGLAALQTSPHRQGAECKVRDHLLVRELVAVGRLDYTIQHQHAPEGLRLQQCHILCGHLISVRAAAVHSAAVQGQHLSGYPDRGRFTTL